jgi:putative transposase
MKFEFIEKYKKIHSIKKMAKELNVSCSGYYSWRKRERSKRQLLNEKIISKIKDIQEEVKYSYGSPRIFKLLKKKSIKISRNKVARLMKENNLNAKTVRKFKKPVYVKHNKSVSDNILNRNFKVSRPDKAWVSDITYIPTFYGWIYLCTIIDLFSRKVIGWDLSKSLETDIVLNSYNKAKLNRKIQAGLIFHSDRGVQYCSERFRRILIKDNVTQSMSRKGNCWDNACAESFFKTIKSELIQNKIYMNFESAKKDIFEYIEVFYNRQRLHSFLNYKSPFIFELENAA